MGIFPGPPICFNALVTITGASQDITTQLQASAATLPPYTVILETNGVPNGSQALLNLIAGSNIILVDDGHGNITISASGGGGSSGLPDPGNNGLVVRTALNTTAAILNVAAGSALVSGTSSPSYQVKPIYDTRDWATCDGSTNATSSFTTLLTAISTTPATILFGSGQCLLSNISFPANLDLDFSSSGSIKPVTGQTITILGYIHIVKRQIFFNALASQGTVVFTGNTKTNTFYPEWWGAVKNGVANDLAALQATSEAADTVNSGTVDLGTGVYAISTGTWKIANANAQHHINIVGQGPVVTTINSGATGTTAAIYFNTEKFVNMQGFGVVQGGSTGNGVGIIMGGDGTTGTATNGNVMNNILVQGFNVCIGTSGTPGIGTSSEITFINLDLQLCTTGFNNGNFNGLDYTFIQLQMSNNTVGINCSTPGCNILGGSSSFDGTDFAFSDGFGTNEIIGFRSEVATTYCINDDAPMVTVINFQCQGLSTPASHTAILQHGAIRIQGSYIGGQILNTAGGNTSISDSWIIDPNNTWTLTSQTANMGPGFRISNAGASGCGTPLQDCGHFDVRNVEIIDASSNTVYRIPGVSGWYTGGSASSVAIATNMGQAAALTVSGNAISPTAYFQHVGAGLIKNINLPSNVNFPTMGTANWEMACIQLIADSAYTTDTTGNISVALTSITGQVITWCYDSVATKWYPSGTNAAQLEGKTWEAPGTIGSTTPNTGAFTTITASSATITGSPGITTGTALNTDLAGELAFSGATTSATYSFIGSYVSHPECTFGLQFDPGAHRVWMSTLSTTTLQFTSDAAQTGSVSYICVGRN